MISETALSWITNQVPPLKAIPQGNVMAIGSRESLTYLLSALEISIQIGSNLSYGFSEQIDENQDTICKTSWYSLINNPRLHHLIKFAQLSNPDPTILIVLDWLEPWKFINELKSALDSVEKYLPVSQQSKDDLEMFHKMYKDPSLNNISTTVFDFKMVPLQDAVLTNNLGKHIIIVCVNSQLLIETEEYSEHELDYIQMYLRTISLSYGASIFNISSAIPSSINTLKRYIMSKQSSRIDSTCVEFKESARVVDKHLLLVPAGWDSVSKIQMINQDISMPKLDLNQMEVDYQKLIPEKKYIREVKPLILAMDEQEFLATLFRDTDASTTLAKIDNANDISLSPKKEGAKSSDVMEEVAAKLAKLRETSKQRVLDSGGSAPIGESQNELLASFFSTLLKKS